MPDQTPGEMSQLAVTDSKDTQPIAPYLCCLNAKAAIEFYVNGFGAERTPTVMELSDGKVMHAELNLLGHRLMLSDEFPEMGVLSPETIGNSPVAMILEVADADAFMAQALKHGATELQPVSDQFYGKRAGQLRDPFGHRWGISMHLEDLTYEELFLRAERFAREQAG